MIPLKTIEELIIKHSNLEKDLSSSDLNKNEFAEKSKEYSGLNEIIQPAKKYLSFEKMTICVIGNYTQKQIIEYLSDYF